MQQHLEYCVMRCSDNLGLRKHLLSEITGSAVIEIVFEHVSNKKHGMTHEDIVSRCRFLPVHMTNANVGIVELITPKVDTDTIILSGDFKPVNSDVVVPYKNIPMLKLSKGSRLHLRLMIGKGTPRDHALFTTVSDVATCSHGWLHVATVGTKPLSSIVEDCRVFYKDLEVDLSRSCNECTGSKAPLSMT